MKRYCDCCNFETNCSKFKLNQPSFLWKIAEQNDEPLERWLCNVCASTQASNIHEWRDQYGQDAYALTRQISYCTNLILKKLGENNVNKSQY